MLSAAVKSVLHRCQRAGRALWLICAALAAMAAVSAAPADYFVIEVVDADTGRGVPLVELRTVNEVAWWTDSAGLVAFLEPGLMNQPVFFQVKSPGYTFAEDGFGYHGVKLTPRAGERATLQLKRTNLAERLYRITGAGIYRDSVLAGHPVPLKNPVLNGQVMGQDTVIATPYRGKIYWFWGDTNRVAYRLGNFGASGATSEWWGRGGLDPREGVDLTYFVDPSGFAKVMCPRPANGMRWIDGLIVVPDEHGRERLVALVTNTRDLGYAYDRHLMLFNDTSEVFEPIESWDRHETHQSSHPFFARSNGTRYCYLYPDFRVPADLASLRSLDAYEAYTCVDGDGHWRGADSTVARDGNGRAKFAWKRGADRLRNDQFQVLLKAGKLGQEDIWSNLKDFETGAPLSRGLACVAWNAYRGRWIGLLPDKHGEVWFAEADTPLGPWGYARRVVTHGDYNFYNLAHHVFFDQDGGRTVFFEGTYTEAFSAARSRTPRYDYNQMMYSLDLGLRALELPVAMYRRKVGAGRIPFGPREPPGETAPREQNDELAFFALPANSQHPGTIPIYARPGPGGAELTVEPPAGRATSPLFVALPVESASRAAPPFDGMWQCTAHAEGDTGDGFPFKLEFSRDGEKVTGRKPDGTPAGSGTLRQGELRFQLQSEDGTFDCIAQVEGPNLKGTWRKSGAADHGTWAATRIQIPTPEWNSPALVALRPFRRAATGEIFYAASEETPPGCTAGPAVCRVWRLPNRGAADWLAEPLPLPGLPH